MGKYTVELSDSDGNACKVRLSLPLVKKRADKTDSTWKTLDKGMIKYHSGGCYAWAPTTFGVTHLNLLLGDYWIVQLSEFIDTLGIANDSGTGKIDQTACLSFKPGRITWALLD